jgi:hypothetical protein
MIENIILALIPAILVIIVMVFVCVVVGGGLGLICRPLGHQYEWEKKLQGECPLNKEKGEKECL